MFNFDADRFLKIQKGAVALGAEIHAATARYVAEGIDSVFFLGTGGAAILMYPAASFLARHSRLQVFTERSAELVLIDHRSLGPRSLVIIPSLSGTTKESIAALDFCRACGARIITLVGHADTPLGKSADRAFVNFAEDDTSSESFYIQGLLIALSLLQNRGEAAFHETLAPSLAHLPQALLAAKAGFEAKAQMLAQQFKDEPYHIITGAGSAWPQAFYYGMSGDEVYQGAALPITVRDTTGAGDSFIAGFIAAHLAGEPVAQCLARGHQAAALTCQIFGGFAQD